MQPLVPLVFHNLPSLYLPSFRRNGDIAVSSCLGVQSPRPTHVACSVGIELTSLIEPGVPMNIAFGL